MSPPRVVWFNQGLSQNYDAVRLIRAEAAGALVVCASHRERDAPVLQVADRGFEEPPRATPEEAYVQWALEICVREQVDLFVPSRHAGAIAAARAQFERRGVRVQVAQAEALAGALEYKDTLYAEVAGQLELPAYRVVSSPAQFDEAYVELRLDHQRLCVKPTRGLFGAGFRILDETIDPLDAILRVEGTLAALAVYRSALAQTRRAFSLMLMEYLEGPERSVDCLAHQGELVAAVARLKHGRHQSLETSGAAIEGARRLVERYRLDGIVNIQFRDTRGTPHLLEINARMAGGMLYSCAALNLPYWSAMLALGLAQPHDVPAPREGLRVAPIGSALIIPNEAS